MRKMRMYLNLMHVWPQHLLPLSLPRTQRKLHTNNCKAGARRRGQGEIFPGRNVAGGAVCVTCDCAVCNRVTWRHVVTLASPQPFYHSTLIVH